MLSFTCVISNLKKKKEFKFQNLILIWTAHLKAKHVWEFIAGGNNAFNAV